MAEYYWTLEKYTGQNSRFRCPNCNKPRQYTRFINTQGEYAPFEYGRCNRVDKCGYFKVPTKIKTDAPVFIPKKEVQQFVDWEEYKHHLDTGSDLIKFMINFFGDEEKVLNTIKKYHVRTMEVNYAVFPFIDNKNRITYVKKMHYINGKRDKKIYRVFKAYKGVFKQCLFGLHLVDTSKNVCVVESEKTALFCDIMYPEYTWVATGGEMMINKINVLEKATVFADKGKAFQYWSTKIDKSRFAMSDVMEKSDLPDGSDLADLIINEMKVN